MDEFFEMSPGSISWIEEAFMMRSHQPSTSAFAAYANVLRGFGMGLPGDSGNVHERMIEFWKNRAMNHQLQAMQVVPEMEQSREWRIMRERLRRRSHQQGYKALHGLLPAGTKGDKRSILQMATKEIIHLRRQKEELEKQEATMLAKLGAKETDKTASSEKAELKLKVINPASGINSMLQVLNTVKATNSTAHAMISHFSDHEYTAVLEFETKTRAADVETAVQRTLYDAERKLHNDKL